MTLEIWILNISDFIEEITHSITFSLSEILNARF